MKIYNEMPRKIKEPPPSGEEAWKAYRRVIFKATEEVMDSPPVCDAKFLDAEP